MEFGPQLRAKNNTIGLALQRPDLTAGEARDAIESCYCVTHYQYVENQAGKVTADLTEGQIIAVMERLYRQAFTRLGLAYDPPTPTGLWAVLEFLDRDLGWAGTDPALHAHHQQICRTLVRRIAAVPPD